MKNVRTIMIVSAAVGLAGCGARDTEVDGIPGPGARRDTPVPPVKQPLRPSDHSTAGINSVGMPSDGAGGNPGPPQIAPKPQFNDSSGTQRAGSTPRPTDNRAAEGTAPANSSSSSPAKPGGQ